MKKKSTKLKKPKFKLPLSPKVVIPVLIVLAVLAFYVVPRIVDYTKFMTLKHDMLAIQSEFNKIDPGWEYSESCNPNGQKFKQNEVSSCAINIKKSSTKDTRIFVDKIKSKSVFKLGRYYEIDDYDGKYRAYEVGYKNNRARCSFVISSPSSEQSFGCSSSALDFYFPRSQ